VECRDGRSALVQAEGHVPYAPRVVPSESGWTRIVLVQTVAGPLADDRTSVEVELGPGAALELQTNAATLAYPAGSAARHQLRLAAETGARFAWLPEPLILASECNLESSIELDLAGGAAAYVRETVVLGRHGERPGRYRSRLRCELAGRPLLHEGVEIDPDGVAQSSVAVIAGARAFASLALLGAVPSGPASSAELELSGPGRVMRALARDGAELLAAIRETDVSYRRSLAILS
jgi:urease accessory protein